MNEGDYVEKITSDIVSKLIPVRDKQSYKNNLGHVLCIGGNAQMGGAIILSATAALASGSGLVTVASHPNNLHALHCHAPECMFIDMYDLTLLNKIIKKADIIVLGPGLGTDAEAKEIFQVVLDSIHPKQWLVIDADGLNILPDYFINGHLELNTKKVVLTPHLGEWKELTHIDAPADCTQENKRKASELNAVVVLKKHRTEIYAENKVWQNTAGNPSMSTGGMGDTLTGIIAGFLGQFDCKLAGIISAVYVHSAIADELAKTHYVTLPTKIIQHLPYFIKNLMK